MNRKEFGKCLVEVVIGVCIQEKIDGVMECLNLCVGEAWKDDGNVGFKVCEKKVGVGGV